MSDELKFERIKNAWRLRSAPVVARCLSCGAEVTYDAMDESAVWRAHECLETPSVARPGVGKAASTKGAPRRSTTRPKQARA